MPGGLGAGRGLVGLMRLSQGVNPYLLFAYHEPGDSRVRNDSDFFYRIKKALINLGHDVIKKEMVKDGHMASEGVYYVRSRHWRRPGAFAVWDTAYSIRSIAEFYNERKETALEVHALVDASPPWIIEEPSVKNWRPR